MNAVERFNGLNGNVISRNEISEIIELAKRQEQSYVVNKLSSVLEKNPSVKKFDIELKSEAIEIVPKSLLECLECEIDTSDSNIQGLGRVAPEDIYQMITDKMIEA